MKEITPDKTALKLNLPYKVLRLGLACNTPCLFCNVPAESYAIKELSTKAVKKVINQLIDLEEGMRLDISGGEPTLRNDLCEIIEYAKDKKVNTIQLQTNGINLSRSGYAESLKKSGLHKVFIGFHSHKAGIHDYLVGSIGAYKKCFQGIRNSLKAGLEVILNPVITSKSYTFLPGYVEFIKQKIPQISSVSLSVIQPKARAWQNHYLLPRYDKLDSYIAETLKKGKKYGIIINNPYCGLPLCVGSWSLYLERCVEYSESILGKRTKVDPNKIKAAFCRECKLNYYCNGVWKEYTLLYSFAGIKPIKK